MKKRTARLLAVASTMLAFAAPGALANPVLAPPGAPTTSPQMTSVGAGPEVGSDLACTTGSWLGVGTVHYLYAWLRDGAPISGETRDNYVVQAADATHDLACRVAATDDNGTTTADSEPETASGAPATMGLTQYSTSVSWSHFPP